MSEQLKDFVKARRKELKMTSNLLPIKAAWAFISFATLSRANKTFG